MAEASRRTTSRRELARHEHFEDVSPQVGELDEDALDAALADDEDQALALLADLVGATDPRLRELARRLAGRIVVDLARRGRARAGGIGSLQVQPLPETGGDLDVDASIEPILEARGRGSAPALGELRARVWSRPDTALCLVVDRSGSMSGNKVATAALAAAAVANRAPKDYSVLAFSGNVIGVKSQDAPKSAEEVVDALLRLRGHGTTDLAGALRAAIDQLGRSRAQRKVVVLLSDCRASEPGTAEQVAAALDELVVVAPADDAVEAEAFAKAVGARWAPLDGPSSVPEVFAELLSR